MPVPNSQYAHALHSQRYATFGNIFGLLYSFRMREQLQIGVMGSDADLNYSEEVAKRAEEVGRLIAQKGHITVYGAEKDLDSLSTAAARGAKAAGGLTVGVTYQRGMDIYDKEGSTDVIIVTGSERGGGREMVLVNSCNVIILISGGSGTLSEAAIAYQMNIPLVALVGTGGWADKLAGTYIDARNRFIVEAAQTPLEAVEKAIAIVQR